MYKILFVTDGLSLNSSTLDFATYLAHLTESTITAVFLENLANEERLIVKNTHDYTFVGYEVDEHAEGYKKKMKLIESNIQAFKNACSVRDLNYAIHRDRATPAEEIITESRFSDIIITDPGISFEARYEDSPTRFTRDILARAECPVIVVASNTELQQAVFAYDGSAEAVFALKQFTYLFPQFRNKNLVIIEVKKEKTGAESSRYQFKEWLKNHYNSVAFEIFEGDVEMQLFGYLFTKKQSIVIMGAYSRNRLSRMFAGSKADFLIKALTLPIFIAHP